MRQVSRIASAAASAPGSARARVLRSSSRRSACTAPSAPAATTTRSRYHAASYSSEASSSSRSAPRCARRTRCSRLAPRQLAPRPRLLALLRLAPARGRRRGRAAAARRVERRRGRRSGRVDQAARRAAASGSSSRSTRSSRPAAMRASASPRLVERGARVATSARTRVGQPAERDELAARADRLGQRPELVGDEDDRRVRRRLLEILEQRVGGVLVHQVRVEEQVDAAVGLERPHVQVAAQLADRVDADLVAERLEHVEVGVRAAPDAAAVADERGRERERGACACPRRAARGRDRRAPALGERRVEQALGLGLLEERSAKLLTGPLGELVGGRAPSSVDDALREALRQLAIRRRRRARGSRRPRARCGRGAPDARGAPSSGSTSSRKVRSGRARRRRRGSARAPVDPEPPGDALVGERGVDVAVADDGRAAVERGPDHLVDELRARGGKERRLGPGRHVAPCRTSSRIASPSSVPPGSGSARPRALPLEALRQQPACVVLPEPSRPSKVTNTRRLGYGACGRSSPEGRGFIGSHVVDALVARGDEVARPRQPLARAARERRRPAPLHRARHPRAAGDAFDEVRPERRASTSPRRPMSARPSSAPTTTRRSTCSGRSTSSRRPRRTGAQVVFSSTGGAIYGECDGPHARTRRAARSRRTGWPSSRPRNTSPTGTACTGRATSRSASANVYGPRQGRTAKAASSRSSSSGCRRRADRDLRRRGPDAGLRLRRRRRRGDARGRWARRRRVQRRHRDRDLCGRAVRPLPGASRHRGESAFAPERLGRAQRSVLDATRAEQRTRLAARAQPRGRPPRDLRVLPRVGRNARGPERIRSSPWRSRAPSSARMQSRTAAARREPASWRSGSSCC